MINRSPLTLHAHPQVVSGGDSLQVWRVAVKTVKVLSNRTSYRALRGCWCDIIVLNVPAVTEGESEEPKDSFCEELCQVLDQFPKYLVKILLQKFSTHLGWEDTIKLANRNDSLNANTCTTKPYNILKVVNFVY